MAYDSLNAISSRIWEEVQGGWIYDDERVNVKMIRDLVQVTRAEYIEQLAMSKMSIPAAFYQECCVDVKCGSVCEGSPVTEEYVDLPSLLGMSKPIKYLGTADRKLSFDKRETVEDFVSSLPFVSKPSPYYFLVDNNKAIIKNKPIASLKKMIVVGLFADPLSCKECDLDSPYPVPSAGILNAIEQNVLKRLAGFMIQRRIDKVHNANPDN